MAEKKAVEIKADEANSAQKKTESAKNDRLEVGFKGYYLSRPIDTSKIEAQHKEIERCRTGKLACFIEPFMKAFNNLVNLDYVIKSDKLEEVDYGEIDEQLKDIKYGLITNGGILAFQYKKGKVKDNGEGVFGFRNNSDFGLAINTILKKKDSQFKIISLENLKNFYKKSKITGKCRTCQLQDSFVKNTHLIYVNPMKREFKVLPNKNHMLALQQILQMASDSRENGDKLDAHALEVINGLLFKGTERDGERGLGKFRDTNVLVNAWDVVVIREVLERDYLGNPTKYNNRPLVKEVQELINWYNTSDMPPIVKACLLNLEISRIQPFRDGNKRTARLFTNYELAKNGYPIIAFRTDTKGNFDERLARGINTKDVSEFAEYVVKMIEMQQQAYLNEFETLSLYLEDDMEKEHSREGETNKDNYEEKS